MNFEEKNDECRCEDEKKVEKKMGDRANYLVVLWGNKLTTDLKDYIYKKTRNGGETYRLSMMPGFRVISS